MTKTLSAFGWQLKVRKLPKERASLKTRLRMAGYKTGETIANMAYGIRDIANKFASDTKKVAKKAYKAVGHAIISVKLNHAFQKGFVKATSKSKRRR